MSAAASARALRPLARARARSLRAEFVRILRGSLDRHDISHDALAEHCGRTRQCVTDWCNDGLGDDGRVPSVLDELAFPACVQDDLAAWRASRRLCVVVPSQPDGLDHHARLAALTTALTAPLASYAVALADTHVCRRESADVVLLLDRAAPVIAGASLALKVGS